jgi:hypothetical protein
MLSLEVELSSVAVAILHEFWDRRDSSRRYLDYLIQGVVEVAEETMEQQEIVWTLRQAYQLSTIPSLIPWYFCSSCTIGKVLGQFVGLSVNCRAQQSVGIQRP